MDPAGSGANVLSDAIEDSGLVPPGSSGVVMLSGGADSCALTFGLAQIDPAPGLHALHVNYGLRPDSGDDEIACVTLCEALDIDLTVVRPERGTGNLHAWARRERYRAAEELRTEHGLDWIAVAHTAGDLAETVIYRLAVSPGTRPLATMPARRGVLIRPLLGLSRGDVRKAAVAAGLPFVDDRSNDDPAFARARIRNEVLPVLADLNPAVLTAIATTRDDLVEELDFLVEAGSDLIETDQVEGPRIRISALRQAHPAVRRSALRSIAESVLGRPVSVTREQTAAILRLAESPEGGRIDLGKGASLVAQGGTVTVEDGAQSPPPPVTLELPGVTAWGNWSIVAEEMQAPFVPAGPDVATLDAELLGGRLEVRSWRDGDRIRPLGMEGSKSLQDLFTDRRVRRSERHRLPVVLAGAEVVWVPGVAVSELFRLTPESSRAIRLTARRRLQTNGTTSPDWA